jgi:hypothetical protein
MPINHTEHRGFIKSYDGPVNKLAATTNILPIASSDKTLCNMPFEVNALWDTGATLTFIKPKIRDHLKLRMVREGLSSVSIAGLGGLVKADFTIISILLTSNFIIEYCPAYVLDFPVKFDMVIGMDIINMGDFAVCNTENKTSFSFVVPPLPERINFADKAEMFKRQKKG